MASLKVVGAAGAAALFLSGCNDGSSTSTPAPEPETQSIADLAVETKDLSTLVTALSACDLVSTFNGTEKFTVFAPTNAAFGELDSATLNCLLAPVGLPTLTDVLKYHVVAGAAFAKDLSNGQELDTLDGKQKLEVDISGSTVKVGDGTVIAADIMASNGVIHEVDSVLIPGDFVAPMCGDAGSIADLAVATKPLSTLVAALSAADLVGTFNGTSVFTVFAPTDDAFAALGDGAVACLTEKANIPALTEVLKYHVVAGYDLAASITDGLMVDTLDDQKLTFTLDGGMVKIDGKSTVTAADNYATNGVVHVIDAVLIPDGWTNPCAADTSTPAPDAPTQSIADLAVATKDLSTLVTALSACDLVSTFNGTDEFTVFAPTNAAFGELDSATLNCLLAPVGLPTLTDVLKYHVVSGAAFAKDLSNGQKLDTLDGKQKLNVHISGSTVKVGDGAVIAADIMASNGVVHEVDSVLIPGDFVAPMCGDAGSIADLAVATKPLSTLVAALSAADLVDTFNGTSVFTVFAPTDDAFAALGDGAVACLTEKANIPALTEVLKYHVVAGYALSSSITDGLMVDTLDDQKLTFTLADGSVKIDGKSTVTAADNYATNGVVHVIDAVLIPDGWTNPCAGSTVLV